MFGISIRNPFLSIDVAWLSLVVSLASLVFTLYFTFTTNNLNKSIAINERIRTYLAAFSDTIVSGDEYSVEGYNKLTKKDQLRVQILDGMMASIVDAMYQAGDDRVDIWAEYLRQIKGPMAGGMQLEAYATQPQTRRLIEEIRKSAQ
jgi:hypothetical protein